MATAYNPSIVRDGLVLCLDAANPKSVPVFSVEVLVVAGGGGGGCDRAGGGGAGGLIYNSAFSVNPGTALTVTVGGGGAGGTNDTTKGTNGSNSVFGSLTAIGGGGGGSESNAGGTAGGSGGGGAYSDGTGGAGTSGQGFAGGTGRSSFPPGRAPGGGGGAGEAGQNGSQSITPSGAGARGGNGLQYSISGTATYYAGGGGAGSNIDGTGGPGAGAGGLGGGGTGGVTWSASPNGAAGNGSPGTPNTGGGGGGGTTADSGVGGAGGSGIVIVRYRGPQKATGGTITSVDGYTIHSFTTVGSTTFTPNATWSDILGNGITGTLTNSPTFSLANGGGVIFNGSNQYVDCGNSSLLQQSLAITMSAWVNPISSTGLGNIMAKNGNSAYRFRIENGSLWWYVSGIAAVGGSCPNNVWSHCTVTGDSSGLKAYVNGVLTASNASAFAPTAPAGGNLIIGAISASSETFNGTIATAQLYNRALSAAEILQNFNALRGRYGV